MFISIFLGETIKEVCHWIIVHDDKKDKSSISSYEQNFFVKKIHHHQRHYHFKFLKIFKMFNFVEHNIKVSENLNYGKFLAFLLYTTLNTNHFL